MFLMFEHQSHLKNYLENGIHGQTKGKFTQCKKINTEFSFLNKEKYLLFALCQIQIKSQGIYQLIFIPGYDLIIKINKYACFTNEKSKVQ